MPIFPLGDGTFEDRLLACYGPDCYICGRSFESWEGLEIDHVFPVSLGGTGNFQNLRLTHKRCNRSKGPRLANPYGAYYADLARMHRNRWERQCADMDAARQASDALDAELQRKDEWLDAVGWL